MNARTRSILAAALAMTVLAPLSLTLPSAWSTSATATLNHAPRVSHAPARAAAVRVHVTVRKHRIIRSRNGFRPGKTVFDVRSPGGPAAIQLLRLRKGYSLADFRKDAESDSLQALRRIDRKVVFYAGLPVFKGKASHFGARLEAGHYFLFDFDTPRWVRLRVEGAPQRRYLPRTTGSVDLVLRHQNHRFQNPRRLPRSGWLRQTNRTDEPHFMDMTKVKRSTTRRQVRRALAGQGPEDPKWALHDTQAPSSSAPGARWCGATPTRAASTSNSASGPAKRTAPRMPRWACGTSSRCTNAPSTHPGSSSLDVAEPRRRGWGPWTGRDRRTPTGSVARGRWRRSVGQTPSARRAACRPDARRARRRGVVVWSVCRCAAAVVNEEWRHRDYAERDLAKLI